MFGLSKREAAMPDTSKLSRPLYGENYMHQTDREDWDVVNRELFAEVIEGWPTNAIALISNTNLGNSDLRVPYMRLQPEISTEVRHLVIAFTNEHFGKIFEMAKDKYPDVADCYRVRNLGLPNNALVYLIEHHTKPYRSMLVFGGERLKGKLEARLEVVNSILSNMPLKPDATPAKPGEASKAPAAADSKEPPGFSFTNMRSILSADDDQLVAREEWLEGKIGKLDYRERVEMEKIQAELRRRTKRRK
jgi:hypothetical protein